VQGLRFLLRLCVLPSRSKLFNPPDNCRPENDQEDEALTPSSRQLLPRPQAILAVQMLASPPANDFQHGHQSPSIL